MKGNPAPGYVRAPGCTRNTVRAVAPGCIRAPVSRAYALRVRAPVMCVGVYAQRGCMRNADACAWAPAPRAGAVAYCGNGLDNGGLFRILIN